MKKLIFKEVSILSKAEKAARREVFSPSINLVIGENDVGKSTLIKSLYHTLGADTPGLQNREWKNAKPIYFVRFSIDGVDYGIVRDEKYFGVFDAKNNLLGKYAGIGGDKGIARFLNPLLNFRVELERAEGGKLGLAGPAYYFLPYYIDQDDGWVKSWNSFDRLQQFSAYRKHMLEYHLGVRPQSYYDAKRSSLELTETRTKLETERAAITEIRASYQKKKVTRQVEIDPALFRHEAEQLVDEYNKVYVRQQEVVQKLKDIRNERHGLENEIVVLQRAIRELDADYAYAEDPQTPELIACPTCGTEIANSMVERFGILDDADYCYELIDQRRKKIADMSVLQKTAEDQYHKIAAELAPIDELLKRKREKVTFSEFVSAEGVKEVMRSISEDINDLIAREDQITQKLDELEDLLKVDSKRRKEINEFYQARMKEFLSLLRVNVLNTEDYNTIERQIKTNALGSDLPRSLLAQVFAFLHSMEKFNKAVVCPMVLDSPLQQEQDPENIAAIFRFIFSKIVQGQQLIVGTLTVEGLPKGIVPEGVNAIELNNQYQLLQKAQYEEVFASVGPLHDLTLAE